MSIKRSAIAAAFLVLAAVAPTVGVAAQFGDGGYGSSASTPPNQIDHCEIRLIREAWVPAPVPGVIDRMDVHEGDVVSDGQPLAQIDAREAEMELKLANDELDVAQKEASNDIDQKVALAAYWVARKELDSANEANKKSSGAISATEIARLGFEVDRARYAYYQAKHDFEIAKVTVQARQTQVAAAQLTVDRHLIKAPIAGIVEEVLMHPGEWANPGEQLLRIVQLDQLKVQGYVNSLELHPSEVLGRSVTVDVELARGRHATFTGKISFASTNIRDDDNYPVTATVDNRQENGFWVLSPGMVATMTIDVGTLKAVERAVPSGSGTR
ncbi:MAG: HlyD family efflux transporter periplasmic adaptor subunit [Pirellulales bacterium]